MIGRRDHGNGGRLADAPKIVGLLADIGGAIAAVSMLAAVVFGAGTAIVGIASDRPGVVLAGSAFASGVALGASCMYAIHTRLWSSVESQLGYRWISATYTYQIDATDPRQHCQKTDITIKALRDGVRTFSNQYRWSGSGEELVPQVVSSGHYFAGEIERSLAWRRYDVRLEPHLRRGERTTVSVLQQLYDSDERFELFLAKSVHQPTEQLVLRVELPMKLVPNRVWTVEQFSAGPGAQVIKQTELEARVENTLATMEWRVVRPVQGRAYQLRWNYLSDRSLYNQASTTSAEDDTR